MALNPKKGSPNQVWGFGLRVRVSGLCQAPTNVSQSGSQSQAMAGRKMHFSETRCLKAQCRMGFGVSDSMMVLLVEPLNYSDS